MQQNVAFGCRVDQQPPHIVNTNHKTAYDSTVRTTEKLIIIPAVTAPHVSTRLLSIFLPSVFGRGGMELFAAINRVDEYVSLQKIRVYQWAWFGCTESSE